MERQTVADRPALYLHWLTLRHPAGTFSAKKPQLPGQEVPGLGMSREAGELLTRVAVRLGLDALAWTPAWYHTARISVVGGRFEFVDAARQGRFEALERDLGELPLREVTLAMAEGRVRLLGAPYAWEPTEMAMWLATPPYDAVARAATIAAERERCRFELTPGGTP